jgi:hypothetical protein
VSHGDVALAEAWARALVARGAGRPAVGVPVATPDQLVDSIAADDRARLTSLCPTHVVHQCWSTDGEAFVAADELVATVGKDLARLSEQGVDVMAVRSVIVCARALNDAVDAGKNRFVVDLHAMERLVLELRDMAGADVHAVCGKVGGFGKYSDAFGPLGGRLHTMIEESRARSVYRFPNVGELAFVRDGDASDLVVAMASMVGKYLRELLMERIVTHYKRLGARVDTASGYHDPITAGFVKATRLLRKKTRVPDACFERRALDGPPSSRRRQSAVGSSQSAVSDQASRCTVEGEKAGRQTAMYSAPSLPGVE